MAFKNMTNSQLKAICMADSATIRSAFPHSPDLNLIQRNDFNCTSGSFDLKIGDAKIISGAYDDEHPQNRMVFHHLGSTISPERRAKLGFIMGKILTAVMLNQAAMTQPSNVIPIGQKAASLLDQFDTGPGHAVSEIGYFLSNDETIDTSKFETDNTLPEL